MEQRRKERKITIMDATLSKDDQSYGQPVECDVCNRPHSAFGLAIVEVNDIPAAHYWLCEPCRTRDDFDVAVFEKFVPGKKIKDATLKQMQKLAEGPTPTEH